jgi:AraC-like DNA-binding protein
MDHLASLFDHFAPRACTFFSGNLCQAANFADVGGWGYLHILRGGQVRVASASQGQIKLVDPSLLLVSRDVPHRFEPDSLEGADLVCARIEAGGSHGNPMFLGMPEMLVIPLAKTGTIRLTLDLLQDEAFATRSGRQVALDRLFEYLFVQLIRHVVDEGLVTMGTLAGLADQKLGPALTAMHDAPARVWTLDGLAQVAGMSRTRFAARFRAIVGSTPIDYLTRWRMTIAQELLRKGRPIKSVARSIGYDSPAALSRTFSKIVGTSPREWQAEHRHM